MARKAYWGGKQPSDTIEIDALAKLLDIPSFSAIDEATWEYVADAGLFAHDDVVKEDGTDAEAEAAKEKAEGEAQDRIYKAWKASFDGVVSSIFGEYGDLAVESMPKKEWLYKIRPRESWEKSAKRIMEVINGVGYFHFSSLDEFLRSGPWTARQATLEHLHWVKDGPAVYGDADAHGRFDRAWRELSRSL
jgi:hypothetical protein